MHRAKFAARGTLLAHLRGAESPRLPSSAADIMKGSHNAALVAFSILIAILASYSALALSARVSAAYGRFRVAWLAGGSVALGIGIWSMHFVGMLAYRLPVPISYAVPLWLLSMLVAIGASLLALWVTSRPIVPVSARAAAGVLLGLAVAGMHYLGMAAMRVPGRITYQPAMIVLSVAVAVAAGCGVIWIFMRLRGEDSARGQQERIAAGVVMGGALAAIHYTGMAAARFTPPAVDAVTVPSDSVLRTEGLAAAVIVATLAVLVVALMTTRVDRRLRARDEETEAVRRSESRFRSLVVASAQVVWTASADGQFAEPQTSWAAYTGTGWAEYGSGGWTAAVHPDDRARVAAEWRQAVAERRVMEVELRLRRADGAWRHVAAAP
jgi:PAS domain S-box-containing protein